MQIQKINPIPDINGMYSIDVEPHIDIRGSFQELYKSNVEYPYFENGIQQVSISQSHVNVIRGLHFQIKEPMAKMVKVLSGYIYLFAIDINPKSDTFKNVFMTTVSFSYNRSFIFPPNCAIGYLIREPQTVIQYFHNVPYNKEYSFAINIFDPELSIINYDTKYTLSDRDKSSLSLKEWLKYQEKHNLQW